MSAWPRVAIADVCESIVDCVNKTAHTVPYETPFRMIRTSNVKGGRIDLTDVKYVTEEVYSEWTRRQVPQTGDVILTREAPLGEVGMLREDSGVFLGQRLISYRADPAKLDNRFLLYVLQGPDLQAQIKALGSGSTVEHMRVPDAEKLTLRLPPLDIQQEIGSTLGAYDDLLENNMRRVEILEETARSLFNEWFINFRSPGHGKVPRVPSTIGRIPQGWSVASLPEIAEIDPATPVSRGQEIPFVAMSGLSEVNLLVRPTGLRSASSGARFRNGDTLLARITPCLENGKTGFVTSLPDETTVACGSTEFIVLRARFVCPEFIYLLARSERFRAHAIKSMSGATGRQRVRSESFAKFLLPVPPADLVAAFRSNVAPMFRSIHVLAAQYDNLRRTRALLLPRLVAGSRSRVGEVSLVTAS